MSIGYPDYTRLSRSGNFLLFNGSGLLAYDTNLFAGYVGQWPYVNVFTNMAASPDFAELVMNYSTDKTIATQAGFRLAVRQGSGYAVAQYANLSDWMNFYYITKSGNPMNFQTLTIYGTEGPAGQVQLSSLDVPIFQQNAVIPATTTVNYTPQHVQPGKAVFAWDVNPASWAIYVNAYNFAAGAYQLVWAIKSTAVANQGSLELPMLDVPYQIAFQNNDATPQTMTAAWMSS